MTELEYGFAEHVYSPPTDDPQRLGDWLTKLRDDHGGELTPALVVDEASKPKSPGHQWFTWDDQQAAYERRLDQARYLIRAVVIVRIDQKPIEPVRALVNVRRVEDGEHIRVYRDALDPVSIAARRRQLWLELLNLRQRLAADDAFNEIVEAIDAFTLVH
jgi:hypothetical protein